jgi:succinate-semialdehyde dehydrogenase/glutarate-semialdehyde dehydrogenase
MKVAQEEIFGPLVVAMTFKDDAEAVGLANSVSMALNASVWGERGRALAVAAQVKAGTVVINNVPYTYGIPSTPWGGPGTSGGGRTHGAQGFDFLLELKHVHEDRGSSRDRWWEPCSERGLETSRDLTDMLFRGKLGKTFRLLRRR